MASFFLYDTVAAELGGILTSKQLSKYAHFGDQKKSHVSFGKAFGCSDMNK
jgi:hypothetical protein